MKSAATWLYKIIFVVFILFIPLHPANAQQISKPSGQSSSPTDSEKRAGENFNSSFASDEFAFNASVAVQGAPFSAVGIKESTQILSDGRPVMRRRVTSIYRDSEGRTRYEWGKSKKNEGVGRAPIIYDTVSGAIYFLDPANGRARQLEGAGKALASRPVKVITPQSPPDNITQVVGEIIEPLGTKIIEGVKAEGVRVTTTIPATEMPNKQAAKAIYERWYSQELRRNILIKSIDPRFGEALFRLTDIDRSEPARELFQIPVEYKLTSSINRGDGGPINVKLERGDKVSVDNRTTGRIRITGWDKDFVEARAVSERGLEAVRFNAAGDSPQKKIWLKADYARREELETPGPESKPTPAEPKPERSTAVITRPTSPTTQLKPAPAGAPQKARPPEDPNKSENSDDSTSENSIDNKLEITSDDGPPVRDGRPIEVDLEVSVPRYAEIEMIKVTRSEVEVTGIETPLTILGDKSTVILRNIGAVEARTRNGAIVVENASGLVDVVTTSGQVNVQHAGSDVRVLSISGNVQIECARGRVNVDSTDGKIMLNNVQGDVDANTSNSNVLFAGAIRDDGRYHLKSMSGVVEMTVQEKPPGFTAALSSYRGIIENVFQLKTKQSSQHEETVNRRIIGSYGNGRAQIMLDTFDGKVSLHRTPASAMKECK